MAGGGYQLYLWPVSTVLYCVVLNRHCTLLYSTGLLHICICGGLGRHQLIVFITELGKTLEDEQLNPCNSVITQLLNKKVTVNKIQSNSELLPNLVFLLLTNSSFNRQEHESISNLCHT